MEENECSEIDLVDADVALLFVDALVSLLAWESGRRGCTVTLNPVFFFSLNGRAKE